MGKEYFADIGDPAAPVGSPAWCKAAHLNLCEHKYRRNSEVSALRYGLREFKHENRWKQLTDARGQHFLTWEDYVQCPEPHGLGLTVDEALSAIEATPIGSRLTTA